MSNIQWCNFSPRKPFSSKYRAQYSSFYWNTIENACWIQWVLRLEAGSSRITSGEGWELFLVLTTEPPTAGWVFAAFLVVKGVVSLRLTEILRVWFISNLFRKQSCSSHKYIITCEVSLFGYVLMAWGLKVLKVKLALNYMFTIWCQRQAITLIHL